MIDFLFENTDIHRVYGSIDPRNKPSLKLFQNLSFRQEAHFVKSLWFKGEWVDDVVFAFLKEEWGNRLAVELEAQRE